MEMERSLINAIAYAKRKADKEMYTFGDLMLDAECTYYLRKDEVEILKEKMTKYCKKNFLYGMHN